MAGESFEFEFDYQQPELTRAAWMLLGHLYGPNFLWNVLTADALFVGIVLAAWRFWPPGSPHVMFVAVVAIFGLAFAATLIYFPWAFFSYRRSLLEKWNGRVVRVN